MAKHTLVESYLATASYLVQQYEGVIPLNDFLKQYFLSNKKFGSRDRKAITELCYCYYRTGSELKGVPPEEKILISLFLCSQKQDLLLEQLRPEWDKRAEASTEEKISFLNLPFNTTDIFPWVDELSEGINAAEFSKSHLQQPDLFLRIRPGRKRLVVNKLRANNIEFSECSDDCLALPNSTKVTNILGINEEVVVQDYSSQRIKNFLETIKSDNAQKRRTFNEVGNQKIRIWDCCAASGGKSILAADIFEDPDLTVSDIRPSIIHNLKERFKKAEVRNYNAFVSDIANTSFNLKSAPFDLVICDAPCTGSGTWGRTPEQLFFFEPEKIKHYSELQKKILKNIVGMISKNGYLLYITCSVFKKENEQIVEFIQQNFRLQLVEQETLIGYNKKADTMFAALFKKGLTDLDAVNPLIKF